MAPLNEKAVLEMLLEIEDISKNLSKVEQKFDDATRRMEAATKRVDFDETSVEAQELRGEVSKLGREFVREGGRMSDSLEKVGADAGDVRAKMARVNDETKRFGKSSGDTAGSVQRLRGSMVAAGISMAAVLATLTRITTAAIQAAREFDRLERSFGAITGSAEDGRKEFAFVREEANRLGVDVVTLSDSWKTFVASTQDILGLEESRKLFVQVSEAIKAVGGTSADAQGALRALSQVASKGKVSAEELRQQLGERLPRAFQLAAEVFRKEGESIDQATARLDKMLERGEVFAGDFLPRFGNEIEKAFGGKLEGALESAESRLARFQNVFTEISGELLATGLTSALGELEELGQELQDLAETAFGTKVSLEATATAMGFLVEITGEAIQGIIGLSEAMLGLVTGRLDLFRDGVDRVRRALKESAEAGRDLAKSTNQMGLEMGRAAQEAREAEVALRANAVQAEATGLSLLKSGEATSEGVKNARQELVNLAAQFEKQGQEAPASFRVIIAALAELEKKLRESEDAADKLSDSVTKAYAHLTDSSEDLIAETEALKAAFTKLTEDGTKLTKAEMDKFADAVADLSQRFKDAGVDGTLLLTELQAIAEGYGESAEGAKKDTAATGDNTEAKRRATEAETAYKAAIEARVAVSKEALRAAEEELQSQEKRVEKLRELAEAERSSPFSTAEGAKASDELFEAEIKLTEARKDAASAERDLAAAQSASGKAQGQSVETLEQAVKLARDDVATQELRHKILKDGLKTQKRWREQVRRSNEAIREGSERSREGAEGLAKLNEEAKNLGAGLAGIDIKGLNADFQQQSESLQILRGEAEQAAESNRDLSEAFTSISEAGRQEIDRRIEHNRQLQDTSNLQGEEKAALLATLDAYRELNEDPAVKEGLKDRARDTEEIGDQAKEAKKQTEEMADSLKSMHKAWKKLNDEEFPRSVEFLRSINNQLEKAKQCVADLGQAV